MASKKTAAWRPRAQFDPADIRKTSASGKVEIRSESVIQLSPAPSCTNTGALNAWKPLSRLRGVGPTVFPVNWESVASARSLVWTRPCASMPKRTDKAGCQFHPRLRAIDRDNTLYQRWSRCQSLTNRGRPDVYPSTPKARSFCRPPDHSQQAI